MSLILKPWNQTLAETHLIFDVLKVGDPLFEEIKSEDRLTMLTNGSTLTLIRGFSNGDS